MNYLPSAVGDKQIILDMIKVAETAPKGCIVEVGVYKGGTASYLTELAEKQKRKIFLYDTFEGIPFQGEDDKHAVGDFNDTSFEAVQKALPYATVIKGLFPDSAIKMPKVAFVHLDVDQYQSYIDAINYFRPLMAEGGIMWFDDYCLAGAKRAIDELIGIENLKPSRGDRFYTVF